MATPRPLADTAATIACGHRYGLEAQPGAAFALRGDLGSGKTHFTKGLATALGFTGTVTSPTFPIVHEYRGGRLPVFHFDFYRIESEEELLDLGWDDYLDQRGVIVAEWADKFPALLPAETHWLHLTIEADGTRALCERRP